MSKPQDGGADKALLQTKSEDAAAALRSIRTRLAELRNEREKIAAQLPAFANGAEPEANPDTVLAGILNGNGSKSRDERLDELNTRCRDLNVDIAVLELAEGRAGNKLAQALRQVATSRLQDPEAVAAARRISRAVAELVAANAAAKPLVEAIKAAGGEYGAVDAALNFRGINALCAAEWRRGAEARCGASL